MSIKFKPLVSVIVTSAVSLQFTFAQNTNVITDDQVRITELTRKVDLLEKDILFLVSKINNQTWEIKKELKNNAPLGLVLFLFGGFCALWAQNTRRNAWSWFFLGLLFSVLTVIGLLIRNADDNLAKRVK